MLKRLVCQSFEILEANLYKRPLCKATPIRIQAGLEAAKARSRKGGRRPKLGDKQRESDHDN
jgi:hypothetical protein